MDISKKLGGDFELAVLSMCSDKYEFLAGRIELFLKKYSADTEGICRVLGCLSRVECVKLREAYDNKGYGRTLKEVILYLMHARTAHYRVHSSSFFVLD